MSDRGRVKTVRIPAEGVAVAMCYLARTFPEGFADSPVNSWHREPCKFCDFSDSEVQVMLDDFNDWAGVATGIHPAAVMAYLDLEPSDQMEAVEKARRVG